MSEDQNMPAWRKKFLATRMTIESILFEKELLAPQREKFSAGLLWLGAIWLAHALLLAQWALRRGYFFTQADAESFTAVLRYASYLNTQGFWAFFKPEFSGLSLNPPLYYLAYVPVLKYLTADLNLALIAVNSAFLLVLALSVFLAVRKSRPNAAGWLGAAFALALPFVQEAARRPSPELALIAMVAAMYACYIRSEEFQQPKWTFAFALCISLGFYSHKFFWLYFLPLIPFIGAGFASPYSRDELFKGIFPGVVLNLPWYLFLGAAAAAGFVPLWGDYHGFWHYFKLGAAAGGLPLFALGAAALAWLYFSVFMPYEEKKIVAAWFWVPYLLLTWLVRGTHPQAFYPALLPFAIALPVMTPHKARKYLLAFVLALGAVGQSGLLRPVFAGKYQLAGLPLPPAGEYRAAQLLDLVKANTPAAGGLVGVYGGDAFFNSGSLRFYAAKENSAVRFAGDPACPACAFVLVYKGPRFGEQPSASSLDFLKLKKESWFPVLFEKKADLDLADTSRAEVYVKLPDRMRFFEEGSHQVRNLRLGPLKIEEATLTLADFNEATGVYGSAKLFAPYASALGGDIYGLTAEISGLAAAGPGLNPFVPAGISGVRVTSAKISAYAVERFLAERFPALSEIEVKMDDTLEVSALVRGRRLSAEFKVRAAGGTALEARPASFSVGPVLVPDFLLSLFTFRYDFSDSPYGVKVKSIRLWGEMAELN
ncbi:MAG: hypothetical protein NDI60_09850 [Elusimicrobiales bacterium]|nr:hypothetical protein [Elusimicrobiales bacterium]